MATWIAKSTEYRPPGISLKGPIAVSISPPQRQRHFWRRCFYYVANFDDADLLAWLELTIPFFEMRAARRAGLIGGVQLVINLDDRKIRLLPRSATLCGFFWMLRFLVVRVTTPLAAALSASASFVLRMSITH
jgi:hypothetical protein